MAELPDYSAAEFNRRLAAAYPVELPATVGSALFAHYLELRRWAPTLALVGAGVGEELFERHYVESLAAAPLLPPGPGRLLDIGSGQGFPGLVLAALRPDLEVTLVEARERKWAFLAAASRRAGLECRCLNARVSASSTPDLPPAVAAISIVTVRALKLEPSAWAALAPRLAAGARALLWSGEEVSPPPAPFEPGRSLRLSGERRWIREYRFTG